EPLAVAVHALERSLDRGLVVALIPAHDEEGQIGEAVRPLHEQVLRPDLIVAVADNCSDGTALEAEGGRRHRLRDHWQPPQEGRSPQPMPYGAFRYVTDSRSIADAHDWSILRRRPFEQLVLSACHPLYSASHRVVVSARLSPPAPPTA